jgi:outer membrane lipoprotein-sorting protein
MDKYNHMMRVLTVALALLWTTTLCGDDVTTILEKSETAYARAGTFSAEFVQTIESGDFFEDERIEGKLLMEYPNRFRLDTPEQVIACDGETLWSYSVENEQVLVEPVAGAEDLVTPADYLFNFKENFRIAADTVLELEEQLCYRLSLEALTDEQFVRQLDLYLDYESYEVAQVSYTDINDNLVTMRFHKLKLGEPIPAERFRFQTPKGVEEVRLP